jgi:hypothetical protein
MHVAHPGRLQQPGYSKSRLCIDALTLWSVDFFFFKKSDCKKLNCKNMQKLPSNGLLWILAHSTVDCENLHTESIVCLFVFTV